MGNLTTILSIIFSVSAFLVKAQPFDSTRVYPIPVGNYWGYINGHGDIVIEPIYDYAKPFSYNNQSAIVAKEKYYGIIDIKGNKLVPTIYHALERHWDIKDGMGHLYTAFNGYKYGVINLKNEILIPFEYHTIKAVQGCFLVEKNKKHGLLNLQNQVVIPIDYSKIKSLPYSKGIFMAKAENKKWAVFDTSGRQITAPIFDYPNVNFTYKYLNGLSNSQPITVDYQGNVQENLTMKVSKFYKESKAIARDSTNRYGIIDQNFNWVLKPKYQALVYDVRSQNSEIVLFLEGEYWGLLNMKGERLIEPQYEYLDYISEALIAVSKNGKDYRILNWKTGEYLTDSSYTQCRAHARTNRILVNTGEYNSDRVNQWGLLSRDGSVILKPQYEFLLPWEDIVEVVAHRGLNAKGIYSVAHQEFILPPVFSAVDYSNQQLCQVRYGLASLHKIAYFSPNGSLVWSSANFDVNKLIRDYYKTSNSNTK